MALKIVVSNESALKAKYGAAGVAKIRAAFRRLVKADKGRGITTRAIALDSAAAMKRLGGKAVVDPLSPRENKAAIDAVFTSLRPDYVMILGAIDVVPHQDLRNPTFSPPDDPDRSAFGDLPYACEAPYSQAPEDFLGATRVVGRLPDVTGATDPKYLVGLLDASAAASPRPASDYESYLGITAAVWKGSTGMSLRNLFGSAADMKIAPPDGPAWTSSLLSRRLHFINCHGGESDPHFYGQKGKNDFPVAVDAAQVEGGLSVGTVATAECCYGAQLYDPTPVGSHMGIANTYLSSGAWGFFGSSTIAYGPADGNGEADLICQFFLKKVLEGASLGRAALEARQEFVQAAGTVDPVELKTLAQFSLLGDPSIHSVAAVAPHAVISKRAAALPLARVAGPAGSTARREELFTKGVRLENSVGSARSRSTKARPSIASAMKKLAAAADFKPTSFLTFTSQDPAVAWAKGIKRKPMIAERFHVALAHQEKERGSHVVRIEAMIAAESGGKILSARKVYSR